MEILNKNQKYLLNALIDDEKKVDKNLYTSGPYWNYKTKKILYWIKKKGLENFRGLNSGVGTSFADNIVLDYRNELGLKGRIASIFTNLPIFKKIYEGQIKLTSSITDAFIEKNRKFYENNEKVKHLISKYKIENSTEFGCELKFKNNNKDFSCHYLNLCGEIEVISNSINYKEIYTLFEIGGGFGANIHLLLNNFKNIKKIIYLDIVPNLFVGTEYLRKFYGDSVKDYSFLRQKEQIKFSDNDDLEIFCIPPWKINNIVAKVDHFHNSSSFQEMPEKIVKNYIDFIYKLANKSISVSLVIYEGWQKNNTLSPNQINELFENKLFIRESNNLIEIDKKLFYLISK